MKQNIYALALACALGVGVGFTSCKPDYETEFHVSTLKVPYKSQGLITFVKEGGEQDITVNTNLKLEEWMATSNAEWCVVTKQAGKVVVTAGLNAGYKERQALVTIAYGHQKYNVRVKQMGKESTLEILEQDGFTPVKGLMTKVIEAADNRLVVPLRTNLQIDHVLVPDTCNWVHYNVAANNLVADETTGQVSLQLDIDPSIELTERYCTLILQSSMNFSVTRELLIKQGPRGFVVLPVEGKTTFEVEDAGDILKVPFTRNGGADSYTIEVLTGADWITATKSTRNTTDRSDTLTLTVAPNEVETPRTGTIKVKSTNTAEDSHFIITVNQKQFVPVSPNNVVNLTATPGAGFITLNWEKPAKANYSKVEVTYADTPRRKAQVVKTVTDRNITTLRIDSTFTFGGEYTFTVKTYGPTGIATTTPLTVSSRSEAWTEKARVSLTGATITSNAEELGEGERNRIPALTDGDLGTFFHTNWSRNASDNKPHQITIQLREPMYKRIAVGYSSRPNGDGGGDVKRAEIYVSETGAEGSWKRAGELTFNLPGGRRQYTESTNVVEADGNYRYIRFQPTERRTAVLGASGTSGDWWNMGEFYLYEMRDEAWIQNRL